MARNGPRRPAPEKTFDPDEPEAGFYRVKLRKGAHDSAVHIWLGHSIDEETGELMVDRPMHWQCTLNGQPEPYQRFWPSCASTPITEDEHDRLVLRNGTLDPDSPFYDPLRPIDLGTAPPPF